MKLLLYCTKSKPYLIKCDDWYLDNKRQDYYWKKHQVAPFQYNGKIVAECDYEVEEIYERVSLCDSWFNELHHTKTLKNKELLKKSCLSILEMNNYFKFPQGTCDKVGYAIHIKNLNIYDKPRGLSGYSKRIGNDFQVLGNAPQNMMKCCEIKYFIKDYILISIRPEWLCKILNNEKTIEIRKKVLKEML